jgi:cobalt-zinc-cadmium efflux system protein
MSGCDHHDHSCHHHHGDRNLTVAVGINLLLTLAQIAGGIFSGSLALIADALHNFSDAASLLLALVARKISRRKADDIRTFGYRKVETLAAFTNLVILILVSLWLAVEAVMRFLAPEPIEGVDRCNGCGACACHRFGYGFPDMERIQNILQYSCGISA